MYPLLWSGQSLRIVRCGAEDVARGDIALGKLPDGTYVAHFVAEANPVRLSSFFGRLDPEGTEILGRADAVRTRGGRIIPIPRRSRSAVVLLQGGLGFIARREGLRKATRRVLDASASVDERLRSMLGAETLVRELSESDLPDARAFVGDVTGGMLAEVDRALSEHRAYGAFQGRKLRALAIREGASWRILHARNPTGERFGRRLVEGLNE
jgi:mycothiol synthase